jgi:cysteine synthase
MQNMADHTFRTPLFQASEDLFLKCEFLHPGRSHKARVARALIEAAERDGEVGPMRKRTLLERTGGNLGIALAMEATVRGYHVVLVTDPDYSAIKKELCRRFGATVIDRGREYSECATNQAVIDILLAERDSDFLYLNQFGNPANPRVHEWGTGGEIVSQLLSIGCSRDTAIVLFGGLGTGASMRGITAALRRWFEHVLAFGVQPAECNILEGTYAPHGLQGISVGEAPPFFPPALLDGVVSVTADEARAAGQELTRAFGFMVGPSSAANYAAAEAVRERVTASDVQNAVYVTLLYDRGEDYL